MALVFVATQALPCLGCDETHLLLLLLSLAAATAAKISKIAQERKQILVLD